MRSSPRTLALVLLSCLAGGTASAQPPPVVVALVVDTSGSLKRTDLEWTRRLGSKLLASLPAGSQAALVTFDDQSRVLLARTSDPEELRRALGSAVIGGRFTAMNDAIYDAARQLKDTDAVRRAMVLVTDGLDENSALSLDDALQQAREAAIPVFAVGVGRAQEKVLRRIAKLTGGEFLRVREATSTRLAERILALPEASAPATPVLPRAAAATAATPSPTPGEARSPQPPAAAAPSQLWPWALAGLVLLVALALLWRRLRSGDERDSDELAEEGAPETVVARLDLGEGERPDRTLVLRVQPELAITSGPAAGSVFPVRLESVTSIGRADVNDVVLTDVSISSEHCRIRPEAGGFVLLDLDSTNGSYVNERRVSRQPLAEGDVIRVGETRLTFRTGAGRG